MKLFTIATVFLATATLSSARPHAHGHAHFHHHEQRSASAAPQVIETVYDYVLNGQPISSAEVKEGLTNGTLVLADGTLAQKDPGTSDALSTATTLSSAQAPASSSSQSVIAQAVTSQPAVPSSAAAPPSSSVASSAPAPATPSASAPAPAGNQASPSSNAGSSGSDGSDAGASSSSSAQGLDTDFPDGQLDCSTFPSSYGAISLDYLNLGGWSGIQCPQSQSSAGFSDITTKTSDSDIGDGDYLSYACPPGYEKTQWPTTQGATGQSVGGLLCQNGKLHLTNPSLSRKLCAPGTTAVQVNVKNTMNQGTSICRTDYPGTEGETIPLDANPGTTSNLTCPDATNYYDWTNKPTSAQYYVNPKGVMAQQGCQWGSPGDNYGNFAPINIGAGYSNNAAWLSIFQNKPTTNTQLDFNIEIVGDNGGYDNLSGRCKYQDGQFYSGQGYSQVTSDGNGCTVSDH